MDSCFGLRESTSIVEFGIPQHGAFGQKKMIRTPLGLQFACFRLRTHDCAIKRWNSVSWLLSMIAWKISFQMLIGDEAAQDADVPIVLWLCLRRSLFASYFHNRGFSCRRFLLLLSRGIVPKNIKDIVMDVARCSGRAPNTSELNASISFLLWQVCRDLRILWPLYTPMSRFRLLDIAAWRSFSASLGGCLP